MFWTMRSEMNKKAQTTLEYAIVIAIIVVGLLGMQIYVRRGFAGRLREAADSVGPQYWPGLTDSDIKTTQMMRINSEVKREAVNILDSGTGNTTTYYVTRQIDNIINDTETKVGNEIVYGQ